MKKFSKLILETKKEIWKKHPLINPVDWDEIFKPLIEHIDSNLKENVPPPGDGIFSSRTKGYLDELIDSITEDYVEYYSNVIDDGSQQSFFNAYSIPVDWNDLMDCLQPLMERTEDVDDYPQWDGGYFYINFINLKYNNTDELIEDILDVNGKLKMFDTNYKISLSSNSTSFNVIKDTTDEAITKEIKNLLELPSQEYKQWVKGLKVIDIFIYNKDTVQSGDLK
jgi:hypothetical protein